MNWPIMISGIFALITTGGHFTVGRKEYLKPMLDAKFDPIAKRVMHCVFHYISTFLILSAIALLGIGSEMIVVQDPTILVQFIAANYAIFAIWQIILASTSGIPKGIFKLFQWVFFVLISGFALVGAAGL